MLAVAAHHHWPVYQLDVNNAFLHGDLHEEVFMRLPEGLNVPGKKVCKLNKSLYGLKQASRQWFAKLVHALTQQNFQQSKYDYSLFINKSGSDITIMVVYVDDILITGTNIQTIEALKSHLHTTFSIKDLGSLHYFLGMEASYSDKGIILTQEKFTKDLLQNSGLTDLKRVLTPLPSNLKLSASDGTPMPDPTTYRSLVGKLNFLTNTRPDLSYSVQTLSQYMQCPTNIHFAALKHTFLHLLYYWSRHHVTRVR